MSCMKVVSCFFSFYSIGTENGNIMLAGELDWETRTYYNLTVNVTDGLNHASTHVYITVLDINEHRPQFPTELYQVRGEV